MDKCKKMDKPIIYIKAEMSVYLNHPVVKLKDVCSIYCLEKTVEEKINKIEIHRFEESKEGRTFLSILYLIQSVEKVIPEGEVRSVGEKDLIINYKPASKKNSPLLQAGKTFFIGTICFLGAGVSIIGYNNDVDLKKMFDQLYETFTGVVPNGPTFVELFYSIGLTVGVFLFFNHVAGKKVNDEPTPIQVQMRLYEMDVNQTFLLGASRKGEEIDVDS